MYKKDLKEEAKQIQGGGPATQDSISDNDLAKLFIDANAKCQSTPETEVVEIFPEVKEIFSHTSLEPSEELKNKLSDSLGDKKIIYKSLLDAHIDPNFLNQISYKLKKFLYADKSLIFKPSELFPIDWQYYELYSKKWRKHMKTYVSDCSSYVELVFKNSKKFKEILKLEFLSVFAGILTAIFIYSWVDLIDVYGGNDNSVAAYIHELKYVINIFNSIALILLFLPIVFLMCMWFINVNHLYKSKNFNFFFCSSACCAYLIFFSSIFVLITYHALNGIFGFNQNLMCEFINSVKRVEI